MHSSLPVDIQEELEPAFKECSLLDHVPVGACVLTPELKVLYWNRSLEDWSGLTSEAVLGTLAETHFSCSRLHHFTRRLQNIVEGGPPTIFSSQLHPHLLPCELPNGQMQVQSTTAKGVRIPGIPGICVLLVIQDVTALSLRIQEYREARDQALQEVEERQRIETTLLTQSEELERSNQELVQFAAIASHDLQEPLRKVITFGDRLKLKMEDQLDETGRDYLERMQNASRRMQRLITDLLSYSQVSIKAQPFEQVNLNQIAQEVVSDLEGRIEASRAQITVSALPTIEAEPFQMRQLFQNIISNALKYAKKDEPPRVTISAEIVETSSRKNSGIKQWQITVEDNGVGFEEQYATQIFGMFKRLHGKDEYEGTGVGLAICKKIVERHDGEISADSHLGLGTTMRVILPENRLRLEAPTYDNKRGNE